MAVCEDGARFDGADIKGLAALTADSVIRNIHSRLVGRPAGTTATNFTSINVFAGDIVVYKPRAACCSGEVSLPAGVSSCTKEELSHRANLSGASETGSLLAEVAVAVFSFVRDTYDLNPALFTEFDTNNGYKALKNILKG
ncbi:hypothetical protein GOODEAATRI_000082 [Goodea atripinnis]|uniref:Uncharacterized protein n=1 Tax=Goodea atripinnis TaxID=208336 RepID=A0ABV0MPC9_9TELE